MPQMSPMNWVYLMIYFILVFLSSMTMLYFIIKYKINTVFDFPPKINKFLLKWY